MLRIYGKFKTDHVITYFTQLPDNRDQARAHEIRKCCENSVYDEVLGLVYNPLDVDQLCPPSVCGPMVAASDHRQLLSGESDTAPLSRCMQSPNNTKTTILNHEKKAMMVEKTKETNSIKLLVDNNCLQRKSKSKNLLVHTCREDFGLMNRCCF